MSQIRSHYERDTEEQLELAQALFRRENSYDAARAAFRLAYPGVPDELIASAAFHVYTDGVGAALRFIAAAELFLRDPHEDWLGFSGGVTFELLYHLYNWHVLQWLMPQVTQELLDGLDDLKTSVESGEDPKEILKAIKDLREALTGEGRSAPDIDTQSRRLDGKV
jgi:hypothetical protein